MSSVISSIVAEFRRYKALGDAALAQLHEAELVTPGPGGGNSAAILVWHLGGNLVSRFTDFLTTDGEKPWRVRDEEFVPRAVTREEVDAVWNRGWTAVLGALETLTDEQLKDTVMIRAHSFAVHDALHRALAHVAYHVGQLVYLAKSLRGNSWECLSIPLGASEAYNKNPTLQDPAAHASAVGSKKTN